MNLKYIDSLRGIAVLGVILVHCSIIGSNNYPFLVQNFFKNGALGVQLFFLVSSFTLFLSYHNRKNTELHPTINFFVRRFFRIAPLYYIAIGYYLFQDGFGHRPGLGDMQYVSNANIASNFLFIHGISPYWINSIVPGGWSISIEMFFYCLLPFLAKKIINCNKAIFFLIITLIFKIISDLLITNISHSNVGGIWMNFIYFYFPTQLPVFAIGILMYFIISEKDLLSSLNLRYVFIASILLVLQIMIEFNVNHLLFSLICIPIVFFLSQNNNSFVVNRFTIFLGKLSFSLYLFHFSTIYWMSKFNLLNFISSDSMSISIINFGIRLVLLLGISIAGANIIYYLIEKPFQHLGKVIINKIESH